jgi:hypothetical protein
MARITHEDKEHNNTLQAHSSAPGSVLIPEPPQIEAGKGAISRYGDALETSSVATLLGVMSSSRESASVRIEAAKTALGVLGKLTPQSTNQQPQNNLTIQLMGDIKKAVGGLADVLDVLDRGSDRPKVVRNEL